jgi:hypothetical protein
MRAATFRRLEHARHVRSVPGGARNSAETMMLLAQVARERHRLEQERRSLDLRIAKIQKRLGAIADVETRLVPLIRVGKPAADIAPAAADTAPSSAPRPQRHHVIAAGVTEVTLQY